jgi:putative tryptophan/tyrosine transport system substrate-binding protein
MRRRQFIVGLGSTAVWPAAARAQQPALPVIGFLSSNNERTNRRLVAAFHRGLIEQGFVEGRNVEILYQWAKGENDQLPALAADLVRHQVSVIVAAGGPAALAAKTTTATVPIVFGTGDDPVQASLVASLSRPGGNLTGVTNLGAELGQKQLELLHELVPTASIFTFLVNPTNSVDADTFSKTLQEAARTLGLEPQCLRPPSSPSRLGRIHRATILPYRSSRRHRARIGPIPANRLASAADLRIPRSAPDGTAATHYWQIDFPRQPR